MLTAIMVYKIRLVNLEQRKSDLIVLSLQLELILPLPTLHGVQPTDFDADDQALMALLGIIQYLHQINAQLLKVAVAKNSSLPSSQMKRRFDLLLANQI